MTKISSPVSPSSPPSDQPLILVDGSSYLYRAFHALPPLVNSKGTPTGAIYGVLNMLRRLIADYQPTHLAVVFDTPEKTFRDDLYPAYKATRRETPNDLITQIEPLQEIIEAMGIPLLMAKGVEADDIIGTIAHDADKLGWKTLISTGDKDMAQLVNPNITLINTMTSALLDEEGVSQKFGVAPNRIIDYLTLVGDTTDNVPGVPQVGPKTAAKWLTEYGSLDNIIAHADEIKGKVGDNLREHLKEFATTKKLVTILLDVPLKISLSSLKLMPPQNERLIEWFQTLEFKSWLKEAIEKTHHKPKASGHYHALIERSDLETYLKTITPKTLLSIDTETTSLSPREARLVGVSLCISEDEAVYIPSGHDESIVQKQLDTETVLALLKPILENPHIKKVGQHIKYDYEVLKRHGITLEGIHDDTMLESYVIDSVGTKHDMDTLALKYLGMKTITYEEVVGKGRNQLTFDQIGLKEATQYAAEDAHVTFLLHRILVEKIQGEKGLNHIYRDIEIPLILVLASMELHGVLIDPELLKNHGKDMEKRMQKKEEEAFALAGETFNMNSPKQLQAILFEKLQLPVLQKTPGGQASTADAVLQELAEDYALPQVIIEYRKLSKLISTYTSRLIEQIDKTTKRVHTSYHQAGTATGRLSSSDPNLQNIPVKSDDGKMIRRAFIAPKSHVLISADYSQIELRLMAHISKDKNLVHAFKHDLDIHKATASEVWGVPLSEVTQDLRRHAKAINFGLIYGMSAFGLSKQIGADRKTAEEYIARYFERYPGVKRYMEETRAHAKEKGYVETLYGRRLYLPDIHASQIPRQRAAERTAINAPLQGSAADLIKMAMIKVHEWLLTHPEYDAHLIMQVHDELVVEVKREHHEEVAKAVKFIMENVVTLEVPLLVAVGMGPNWDAANHG